MGSLALIAVLTFAIGLAGVVARRNLMVVVMCVEVMLNSVVLAFVVFAARSGTLAGAAMAFFIYIAAACEIAVAMAIIAKPRPAGVRSQRTDSCIVPPILLPLAPLVRRRRRGQV